MAITAGINSNNCACRKIVPDKNGVYQGAFVNDNISISDVEDFEKMSGQKLDIALKFAAFTTGLSFPQEEASTMAANNGAIFIKLEPWSWQGAKDTSFSLNDILSGKYDHLLKEFADGAKTFGKPFFVSFGHEMNGDWYPWGNQPELFVKAYRYVHDKISKEYGACNGTWVWNPNIDRGNIDPYYPGQDCVDWVAGDGYNTQDWGANWKTFEGLYLNILGQLGKYGKPIMIGEFACDANNSEDEKVRKPEFLKNTINSIASDSRIKAFIYFDVDKTETGGDKMWKISTDASRKAYHEAMKKNEAIFINSIKVECEGAISTKSAKKEVKAQPAATKAVKKASSTAGRLLSGLMGRVFNGADGSATGENSVEFSGKGYDQGMVLFEGEPLKGNFMFKYTSSDAFKLLFIDPSGNNLKVELVNAGTGATADLIIPKGTTKVNIMAAGKPVTVNLSEFAVK